MADNNTFTDGGQAATLTEQYEQLRCGVLGGHGDGWRHGLGVLATRGMAAWMTACQNIPGPPPAPMSTPHHSAVAALGAGAADIVRILAAMALAHI